MLQQLFETGRIVDVALAMVAVELAVLAILARRRGGRPSLAALAANLAAGAGLMLALRAALAGAGWAWVAAALAASLAAHIIDVVLRFREAGAPVRSTGPRG